MNPNDITPYFALGLYLQEYYHVNVSAESCQQSCEGFCHACFLMNVLLCLSLLKEHRVSENMSVPLKAVR